MDVKYFRGKFLFGKVSGITNEWNGPFRAAHGRAAIFDATLCTKEYVQSK